MDRWHVCVCVRGGRESGGLCVGGGNQVACPCGGRESGRARQYAGERIHSLAVSGGILLDLSIGLVYIGGDKTFPFKSHCDGMLCKFLIIKTLQCIVGKSSTRSLF